MAVVLQHLVSKVSIYELPPIPYEPEMLNLYFGSDWRILDFQEEVFHCADLSLELRS